MADTKISALTADATPTSDDLVVTVNDPGGTPANRKVTLANFGKGLTALPNLTSATASGTIQGGTLTDGTMSITGGNLTAVGSIGTTGARITKLWATDIESTNAIAADITGNAATVTTITGLAPDTATTQATQPNITTCANLTTVGTIGAGVWQGTAIDGAYIDIEGTEIKSTGEAGGTKFLREDGDGTCSWQTVSAVVSLDDAYNNGNTIDVDGDPVTMTVSDGDNNAVLSLVQNDVTNNPNGLVITMADTATGDALFVDHNDTGAGQALVIDSEATTADAVVDINVAVTTGNGFKVVGDALTSGKLAYFYSNSSDNSTRTLVEIFNDNGSADNTTPLKVVNDGSSAAMNVYGASQAMYLNNNSGTINGILQILANSITSGRGLFVSSNGSTTTGSMIYATESAATLTSGEIITSLYSKSGVTANKTGSMNSFTSTRAATSSTDISDDYDTVSITRSFTANHADQDYSGAGSCLYIENTATNTLSNSFSDTVTPLEIVNNTAVSTNFTKIAKFGNITIYVSDGTTAEGALTGVEGDICFNGGTGAGQAAFCDANGTNWTDM